MQEYEGNPWVPLVSSSQKLSLPKGDYLLKLTDIVEREYSKQLTRQSTEVFFLFPMTLQSKSKLAGERTRPGDIFFMNGVVPSMIVGEIENSSQGKLKFEALPPSKQKFLVEKEVRTYVNLKWANFVRVKIRRNSI